jgi:hypothetical protein
MNFPVVLAHGALGPYDELIMLGAVVVFLVMMGISWVRSRNTRPEFEQAREDDADKKVVEPRENPEHFRLD